VSSVNASCLLCAVLASLFTLGLFRLREYLPVVLQVTE
jgi:hypothetical protein